MTQERNTRTQAEGLRLPPLTARSVVASTLLGVEPPVLPVQVLVRSGELFGIAAGTTRVALSRMLAAGELVADGDGRYRLAGHLLDRQRRQRFSRDAHRGRGGGPRWQGDWWLAIVENGGRQRDGRQQGGRQQGGRQQGGRPAAERAAFRVAMRSARLAELREGVWTRPANLADVRDPRDGVTWATARFDDGPAVAARLWDLSGWTERAGVLAAEMDRWSPALAAHDLAALPDTFVLSAAVLRHFQADPLLPAELLPGDWPGTSLRERYDAFDALFVAVWRDWHRSFVSR